jgi:hypothetical protein
MSRGEGAPTCQSSGLTVTAATCPFRQAKLSSNNARGRIMATCGRATNGHTVDVRLVSGSRKAWISKHGKDKGGVFAVRVHVPSHSPGPSSIQDNQTRCPSHRLGKEPSFKERAGAWALERIMPQATSLEVLHLEHFAARHKTASHVRIVSSHTLNFTSRKKDIVHWPSIQHTFHPAHGYLCVHGPESQIRLCSRIRSRQPSESEPDSAGFWACVCL